MMNHMALQGRLTRDVELRQTQSGVAVASFTVAWSEEYKDNKTQLFLDCTAWRQTAEFVDKYFSKGQEVAVEGRLETQKWVADDGQNRSTIKMTVDKVHFCGPKQDGSAPRAAGRAVDVHNDEPAGSAFSTGDDGGGELPF